MIVKNCICCLSDLVGEIPYEPLVPLRPLERESSEKEMATTKLPGAVPKKVYMHYEEGGDEAAHLTLKMTLPSKWASHTVDYLKDVRGVAVCVEQSHWLMRGD